METKKRRNAQLHPILFVCDVVAETETKYVLVLLYIIRLLCHICVRFRFFSFFLILFVRACACNCFRLLCGKV